MNERLRILIVEDSEDDLLLLLRELRRGGYAPDYVRVETAAQMQAALDRQQWDVIVADYTLPQFSAPEALQLVQLQHQVLPFIIVSGTIGEETAVAAMRAGAHDYLLKDNLTRLVPAIERELGEARERQRRFEAEQALRESEERFRQLAENITESVFWISDPTQLQMLYVSPAYERIWGRSCESLYANFMEWIEAIHPEDRQHVHLNFLAHSLLGNYDEEYRIMRADGSLRWIRDRAFPIKDRANVPYRVVGIAEDVTERKLTEAALRRTERLESLGTLASGIAHDLNNILTPLLGIAEILPLKFSNLDHRTQNLLTILKDNSRRGAELVKQILSFTHGIEGKNVCIQINHLIGEIKSFIQQTFPKNIELIFDYSKQLWTIEADSTLIHQVIMNLCVNARDAMPNGGTLTICTENITLDENYAKTQIDVRPGDYIVISVSDTGMGIPPALIERIFDPFFTTKDIGKGTGLGLSIAMTVIKNYGGFIKVDSEMGKGTLFQIFLPASDNHEDHPSPKLNLPVGSNELILVVDDEKSIQTITSSTLDAYNYRVVIAGDGIDAIATYAEQKQEIDVIMLDLMMPLLDAATIVRTLHKLDPNVKIIAMSGLATNEQMAQSLKFNGVRAFLAKPFTVEDLLTTLERVCGS